MKASAGLARSAQLRAGLLLLRGCQDNDVVLVVAGGGLEGSAAGDENEAVRAVGGEQVGHARESLGRVQRRRFAHR